MGGQLNSDPLLFPSTPPKKGESKTVERGPGGEKVCFTPTLMQMAQHFATAPTRNKDKHLSQSSDCESSETGAR